MTTVQCQISKTTPREEVLKRKLDDAGVFSKKPRMDPMVVTDVVVAVDEVSDLRLLTDTFLR